MPLSGPGFVLGWDGSWVKGITKGYNEGVTKDPPECIRSDVKKKKSKAHSTGQEDGIAENS